MGVTLPEANSRSASEGLRPRTSRRLRPGAGFLVVCGYVVAAVVLNGRLWAGASAVSPLGDPMQADNDQFAWFMRYAALAIRHGHLPSLVTQALNAPIGVNLVWNTSFLFPGVVLSPVTELWGPQVSLTIVLTIGYAGSAAAMLWLLRRHGASLLAGGIGGALYGFSPAILDSATGHYNLQFAVLLPLIVEAVLAILTGRGRPPLAGLRLGVLVAAQFFTEEEMLVDLVIACLLLTVVLAASRPHLVRPRIGPAAAGLGTGAATALVLCGYALWIQFFGPLNEHGSPYPNTKFGNSLASFVDPAGNLLFHTSGSAAYAAAYPTGAAEYVAYLGWPLLVVLVAAAVVYWGDLRVRAAALTWVVIELLSLGGNGTFLPFHWLQGMPLLVELLPDRLSILADGAAAAVLAFALDRARSAAWVTREGTALRLRAAAPVVVAVVAVLPLVPRPVHSVTIPPVPAGWNSVIAALNLPPQASVMVVPVPYAHEDDAMRWQSETGEPAELTAGWFIGPEQPSQIATTEYWGPSWTTVAGVCLDTLWKGTESHIPGCSTAVHKAVLTWHPNGIIADTALGTPVYRLLVAVLGQPTAHYGDMYGWRNTLKPGKP